MGFSDRRLIVGTVPCPVYGVGGDALEVALFAMKTLVLDEEPNLTVHDVVDLLRLVLMGLGVITGRPGGDHGAAFIAVALSHNHGSSSCFFGLDVIRLRTLRTFI